jgi:SNF2 family DNA or RNA helicase
MLPPTHPMVANIAMRNALRQNRRDGNGKLIVQPITGMQDKDDLGRPIYRNLRDLRNRLARFSSFLTLEDVNGAEPVVNEDRRYVSLSDQQRAMYHNLVRYGVTQAPGGQLTTEGALALSIRLAQVAGGFAPSDDNPDAQAIPGPNPKAEELLNLLDELEDEKVVVWCRFTAEIKAVCAVLRERYGEDCVSEYHGRMNAGEKDQSKRSFIEAQHRRFFVGQVKAGGTGLDGLQAVARYMVFYSNDYPYLDRLQAISRLARTDGFPVVQVYDLVAQHTIDEVVVSTLRSAQDVSEAVLLGAIVREWE